MDTGRVHHLSDGDEATVHEAARVLEYDDGVVKGRKKASAETFSGEDLTWSTGQYSDRYKKIDRTNDWYDEVVTDQQGVVTHDCHEPLSEHHE